MEAYGLELEGHMLDSAFRQELLIRPCPVSDRSVAPMQFCPSELQSPFF